MRTYTVGNIKYTIPEEIVFLHDTTVIKIESTIGNNIGAEITIVNPNFDGKVLKYDSDLSELYFHLDDVLKSLYNDDFATNLRNPWWVSLLMYDGNQLTSAAFYMQILNGTSFSNRTHSCSPVIYIYNADELYNLQVYAPSAGQIIWNGGRTDVYKGINKIDLHTDITTTGEHIFSIQSKSQLEPIAEITGTEPITAGSMRILFDSFTPESSQSLTGGDIWDKMSIFPMQYKLIYEEHCDDYNFVELRYIDCDGCLRYIGGKLIEETDSSKSTPFHTTTTEIYNTSPKGILTDKSKTLKIGFNDFERIAHISDIQYADYLWIRGIDDNWYNCILKSSNFTTNKDELIDFELEIITFQR